MAGFMLVSQIIKQKGAHHFEIPVRKSLATFSEIDGGCHDSGATLNLLHIDPTAVAVEKGRIWVCLLFGPSRMWLSFWLNSNTKEKNPQNIESISRHLDARNSETSDCQLSSRVGASRLGT